MVNLRKTWQLAAGCCCNSCRSCQGAESDKAGGRRDNGEKGQKEQVGKEEELEGGGISPGVVLGPDTAVSDTPGRLAIRKAEDDLILLSVT